MSRNVRIRNVRQLIVPALFVLSVPILLQYLTSDIGQADAMARGLAGPISWPRIVLYGVFICAMGWFLQTAFHVWRGTIDDKPNNPPVMEQSGSSELVIWIGIGLTLLYGFLIPVVGYPLATAGYTVLWLLLGGIRKPVLITLVSVLGTIFLLYMFVKLALMPLDRGQGGFAELTIAIYRFLHIY